MGLSADDPRRPLYAAARWMPALGSVFFVPHVMIVWNLSNGFDGLREPPIVRGQYAGFEPVQPSAPRPVIPIEADDVPPAA